MSTHYPKFSHSLFMHRIPEYDSTVKDNLRIWEGLPLTITDPRHLQKMRNFMTFNNPYICKYWILRVETPEDWQVCVYKEVMHRVTHIHHTLDALHMFHSKTGEPHTYKHYVFP